MLFLNQYKNSSIISGGLKRYRAVYLLLTLISLSVLSCRVQLISAYDQHIHDQILSTSKEIDQFYTSMLETTAPNTDARKYMNFVNNYVNMEVELRSLLNINSTRSKNGPQDTICKITLNQWLKYKNQHKQKDMLNDFEIKLNRDYMLAQMNAMELAERAKVLGENQANQNKP